MQKYTRGSHIPIETVFYDSTGGVAHNTTSATVNITVSYPAALATTSDVGWPFNGDDRLTVTTTMTLASTATGIWTSTWASAVSAAGLIQWDAVPSDLTFGVNEGEFELTGNQSNTIAILSTS